MFRRFPLFDRLISWTKHNPPVAGEGRHPQWYDMNSLLVDEPGHRVDVAGLMDGTSVFPTRDEMARALDLFATTNGIPVRYGCAWEATRRAGDGFVLETSDGEYECRIAVFAVGVSAAWKPATIPGIEEVPHYMDLHQDLQPEEYAGKTVYIIGKGISAFEIATGLFPKARTIYLSSPGDVRLSAVERSFGGLRARYMQPYEDHALEGRSAWVFSAATERIERTTRGFRVSVRGTVKDFAFEREVDHVIAATGVSAPLLDLPALGVATLNRGGVLPAQTPFGESQSVPGIYFAGSINQGCLGLRGYGVGAVHGFRYNARILAEHIAAKHFGISRRRPRVPPDDVVEMLLEELTCAPELWNQRAFLGRVASLDETPGTLETGILPLTHFVDGSNPGVAVWLESLPEEGFRGGVYVRSGGREEWDDLRPDEFLDFRTGENRNRLRELLAGLVPS